MKKTRFLVGFYGILVSILGISFGFGYQAWTQEWATKNQTNQVSCDKKRECTQEKKWKKERKNQKMYLKTISTQVATTQKLLQQLENASKNASLVEEKKRLEVLITKGKDLLQQQYRLFETIKQNQNPNEEIAINDALWELSTETRKWWKSVLEEVKSIKKTVQQKSDKKR